MKLINIFLYISSVLLIVALPSCDETLPEYQEPPNVLIGKIIVPESTATYQFNVQERFPSDLRFYRVIFYGIDSLNFRFEIQNVYEEVIEDQTDIGGYVKVWDPILPDNYATVPLDRYSLSPSRDTLRIRPGDKIWLKTAWRKIRYDNGIYPFTGKPNEDYFDGRVRYKPITLKAKGYLRLYKKLGIVVTPEISFKIDVIASIYDP